MRPLYRDDNYYPVDVSGNEYKVRVKDNSNDWKYILSFIGIITLLILIVLFSAFAPKDKDKKNDKNQKLNSNINSELNQTDYDFIEIGIQLYNDLEVNDNIKVIRTIYYNKNKEKLYHDDLVEKINMF